MTRWTLVILPLVAMLVACPTEEEQEPEPSTVVLNEFMASNASILEDESGAFPDWIELFNTGTADIPLGSYAVSDSLGQPLKNLLSDDLVIPAGGYLVLYADGDTDQGSNHLGLALDNNGEDLVLSRIVGNRAEIIDSHVFGEQLTDVSEGRLPNGTGDFVELTSPSPGASNG